MSNKKKNKGGAPLGNKNAEKYPKEEVVDILNRMITHATTNIGTDERPEYVHLKIELLLKEKIYNKHWFSEMRRKFEDDGVVSNLLMAIDMLCEKNTYKDGARGKMNANIIKMNLVTHYGYTSEKTQNTNENKNDVTLSLSDLKKQLKELEQQESTWDDE